MFKHVCVALLVSLGSCVVSAKCGNSAIVIDGLITGPIAGSTVSVQVVPDPNWEAQPAVVLDANGQLHVTVYFDRTEPAHDRERCSRKPRTVTVRLHRNGQLIDQVILQVKSDFISKDNTDYQVRSPITLHSH